jgi:hypothetical protein
MRIVISLNIVHCSTGPDSLSTQMPQNLYLMALVLHLPYSHVTYRKSRRIHTLAYALLFKSAIGIVFNFPLQTNRHAIVEWSYGGAMCYIRRRLSTVGHT